MIGPSPSAAKSFGRAPANTNTAALNLGQTSRSLDTFGPVARKRSYPP